MRNRRPREAATTYQGRQLPRPGEEVVDQGLGFDLETLLGRRRLVKMLGLGAMTATLAACGARSATPAPSATPTTESSAVAAGTTAEIPAETAGPYPGDGSNGPDVLSESGIVRSDIRSSFGSASGTAEGVPLELELVVTDLANGGAPFAGVAVYVWHCDREGRYSMYSDGVAEENYLRGVQLTDDTGTVRFDSIFPACYAGRWPHVHFEVYPDKTSISDATKAIATSQVALPEDVCQKVYATNGYSASVDNLSQVSLSSDNVFGDDGGASQLATVTGDVSSGYVVSLAAGVDTRTTPAQGQPPGGGGGAEGGGPGGGQPPAPPDGDSGAD